MKWHDLMTRAAPTTDAGKADLQNARIQMDQTFTDAKAMLVEANTASDEAWQKNVKPALDSVLQRGQQLYEDTSARFS